MSFAFLKTFIMNAQALTPELIRQLIGEISLLRLAVVELGMTCPPKLHGFNESPRIG